MNIHSRFLIHWTGKNYLTSKYLTKLSEKEINNFLQRLRDIVKYGLLMKEGTEKVYGKGNKWVEITIPKVCFTEIKLSQAKKHAKEYGPLGIGFSRGFVLSRYGNPVFYVQNGKNGILVENLDLIRGFINARDKIMLRNLEVILGFIKNMSEKNTQKLQYYDEMEWRIIHSDLMEKEGRIVKYKDDSQLFLKIFPTDVKIIVFPNHKLKKRALDDDWLNKNLFSKKMPMVTTILDCMNF